MSITIKLRPRDNVLLTDANKKVVGGPFIDHSEIADSSGFLKTEFLFDAYAKADAIGVYSNRNKLRFLANRHGSFFGRTDRFPIKKIIVA